MPRGNLDKSKIIEAAANLANEISMKKLNLKMLAQRLNIQPPSLYNHVESLEQLRQDLMSYGWSQVGDLISSELEGITSDDAIRRACTVFYDYVEKNPGIFEAMAYYNREEDRKNGSSPDKLSDVLYQLCRERAIDNENAVHILRMFRSFLEGFALLEQHKAFPYEAPSRKSFEYGVEFLISGLHRLEECTSVTELSRKEAK